MFNELQLELLTQFWMEYTCKYFTQYYSTTYRSPLQLCKIV